MQTNFLKITASNTAKVFTFLAITLISQAGFTQTQLPAAVYGIDPTAFINAGKTTPVGTTGELAGPDATANTGMTAAEIAQRDEALKSGLKGIAKEDAKADAKSEAKNADEDPRIQECLKAADKAATWCAAGSDIDTGLALAAQLSAMQQMNGSSDAHGYCKAAARSSALMGGIQAARTGMCKMSIGSCTKTCEQAETTLKNPQTGDTVLANRAGARITKCESYNQNFILQIAQTLMTLNTFMQSNSCAKATDATALVVPTPGPVDCTDASQAANNVTCICQSNPMDPRCAYGAGAGSGGLNAGTGTGTGAGLANLGDGSGSGLDGDVGAGDIPQDVTGKAASSKEISGGGGGFGGGAGGFGAAGAADPGGASGAGFKTDVVSGVGGGSGGGGSGGGFGGYGRGSGSGDDSAMGRLKGLFNIKDALPDKDKLSRGLAGMSNGAAADGITGAMGESLFQKATRQYRSQQSKGGFISGK